MPMTPGGVAVADKAEFGPVYVRVGKESGCGGDRKNPCPMCRVEQAFRPPCDAKRVILNTAFAHEQKPLPKREVKFSSMKLRSIPPPVSTDYGVPRKVGAAVSRTRYQPDEQPTRRQLASRNNDRSRQQHMSGDEKKALIADIKEDRYKLADLAIKHNITMRTVSVWIRKVKADLA